MKDVVVLIIICFFSLFRSQAAFAEYIIIDTIILEGNNKTDAEVILMELDIRLKDTIMLSELSERLKLNEKRLISIGLFTWADLNVSDWDVETMRASLIVKVRENWFVYPYIVFDLADRNFDVWRKEFNFSLKRVNYGLAIKHINLTGMKDFLQVKVQTGFTQKYEVRYQYPYFKKGWGYDVGILYKSNKEINYKTIDNKPAFSRAEDERTLLRQWRVSAGLYKRVNAFVFQNVQVEYNYINTNPYVTEALNPLFLSGGKDNMRFFSAEYYFRYDKRLYPLYPLGGFMTNLIFRKDGIPGLDDINITSVTVGMDYTIPLSKSLFFTSDLNVKSTIQGRREMPYFLNKAIGYAPDLLTGHQLYVADGTDFYIHKNALKFRLLENNFAIAGFMPAQFRNMNVKLFMRMNFDYAYTRDDTHAAGNTYVNRWIYGYGPSLDAILYNFISISLSYGSTMDGTRGLYFFSGVNF